MAGHEVKKFIMQLKDMKAGIYCDDPTCDTYDNGRCIAKTIIIRNRKCISYHDAWIKD